MYHHRLALREASRFFVAGAGESKEASGMHERGMDVEGHGELGAGPGRAVECPRCGYDQSGEVRLWAACCPLRGRCSECGLELDWSAIYSGGVSRWSLEGVAPFGVTRLLGTLWRSVWPDALWSRGGVTMETQHSLSRQLVFALTAMAAGVAVWVLGAYWQAVIDFVETGGRYAAWHRREFFGAAVLRWELAFVLVFGGTSAAMPVAALLFASTLRRARVSWRHLRRCAVYSLAPVVMSLVVPLAMAKLTVESSRWWGGGEVLWWLSLTPVILAWWWGRTFTVYMRVSHGLWTGVLMAAVCFLVATVVFVLGWGWRGVMELL